MHHLQSLVEVSGTKVFLWCYLHIKILWLVEIYLQGDVIVHQSGIPLLHTILKVFTFLELSEVIWCQRWCLWLTSPSAGLAQNLVCYETQHVTFSPPSPLYAVFIFHWKSQSPAVTVNITLDLTLIHTRQPCMLHCILLCSILAKETTNDKQIKL